MVASLGTGLFNLPIATKFLFVSYIPISVIYTFETPSHVEFVLELNSFKGKFIDNSVT